MDLLLADSLACSVSLALIYSPSNSDTVVLPTISETNDLNEDNSVQASAEISPETTESDEIKEEKENLPEQKICKNCQSPLRQGAKFCSVCGTKYEEN